MSAALSIFSGAGMKLARVLAPITTEPMIPAMYSGLLMQMTNKEVSEDQIELVAGRCQKLCKGCGFVRMDDIEPVAVET